MTLVKVEICIGAQMQHIMAVQPGDGVALLVMGFYPGDAAIVAEGTMSHHSI